MFKVVFYSVETVQVFKGDLVTVCLLVLAAVPVTMTGNMRRNQEEIRESRVSPPFIVVLIMIKWS